MILSVEVDNRNIKKNIVFKIENGPRENCLETAMILLFLFSCQLNYKQKMIEKYEDEFYENNKYWSNKIDYKAINCKISNEISENGIAINLNEYLEFRSKKYINFKKLVNTISNIRIFYYDTNHKQKSENVIKVKEYNQKTGVLIFKMGNFLSKKLSSIGKGHRIIYYHSSIFCFSDFRKKTKNKKAFIRTLKDCIKKKEEKE